MIEDGCIENRDFLFAQKPQRTRNLSICSFSFGCFWYELGGKKEEKRTVKEEKGEERRERKEKGERRDALVSGSQASLVEQLRRSLHWCS
jgi:hypothetical protein